MKTNYSIFNTFLSDRLKVEQLPDEIAGKMWKALVRYFKEGKDTDFGDQHYQNVYEELKRANVKCAIVNKLRKTHSNHE